MTKCYSCGIEMEKQLPPMSAMGERMWGRGLEDEKCMNTRCRRFNQ